MLCRSERRVLYLYIRYALKYEVGQKVGLKLVIQREEQYNWPILHFYSGQKMPNPPAPLSAKIKKGLESPRLIGLTVAGYNHAGTLHNNKGFCSLS